MEEHALDSAAVTAIPLDAIDIGPRLRKEIKVRATFLDSIRKYGCIHPVIVRPNTQGRFDLVAGHARLEAFRLLGRTQIPARIAELDDEEKVHVELDENVQRVPLSELEQSKKRLDWLIREWEARRTLGTGGAGGGGGGGEDDAEEEETPEGDEPEPTGEPSPSEGETPEPTKQARAKAGKKKAKKKAKKAKPSVRDLAEAGDVPRSTVADDQAYVRAAERYPMLGAETIGKTLAIELGRRLDAVDPQARDSIVRLLAKEMPERDALAFAVEVVSLMSADEQRELAGLVESGSFDDWTLACQAVTPAPEQELPSPEGVDPQAAAARIRRAMALFGDGLLELAAAVKQAPKPLASDLQLQLAQTRSLIAKERARWMHTAETVVEPEQHAAVG